MSLASFDDIVSVIGATAEVSAIGGLITANSEGLLDYLDITDTTAPVVGTAFLPNNDAVAAVPEAVRYLTNRPQAFYQTIAAHLSGSTGNFGAPDADPDAEVVNRRRNIDADLLVLDGQTINTLLPQPTQGDANAKFQLSSDIAPTRRRSTTANGLGWDGQTQGLQPYLTATLAGSTVDDAIVGIYNETAAFILPDQALDEQGLSNASSTVLDVLTDGVTPVSLEIELITSLIAAHGLDILAADNTFENNILTAFLPTDDALDAKFGEDAGDVIAFLTWNKFATQLILGNHAVNGTIGYWSENVVNGGGEPISLLTLGGKALNIPAANSGTKLGLDGEADLVTADGTLDIFTENAVVHTFATGLLATADDLAIVTDALGRGENITETLDATTHETLIALFGLASEGVQQAINSDASITTLLAPTEDAFAKLAENQKAYLTDPDNQDQLDLVLKAHLLDAPFWTGYEAGAGLQDANGFDPECSGDVCGGSTLSDPAYAKYGVRYSVDTVIIPDGNTIPEAESSDSSDSSNSAASALGVAGFLTAGCAFALALL
jgi:hypothetical protein